MKLSQKLILFCALALSQASYAQCKVSDIEIKTFRAGFVNNCTRTPCYSLKGVAVITNKCDKPTGVQLQMTGYDKDNVPVTTRSSWPASIRNIEPGEYTFSLDTWLDYDASIVSFTLVPVRVRQWR